jgi:hypothetical protein
MVTPRSCEARRGGWWLAAASALVSAGCAAAVGPCGAGTCDDGGGGGARCAPQAAHGVGTCDVIVGYAWSGTACVAQSGCGCEGADCGGIYPTRDACLAARAACTGPDDASTADACHAQDARGAGDCNRSAGIFWDGRRCQIVWGCECVGVDCVRPFNSVELCQEQHAHCP